MSAPIPFFSALPVKAIPAVQVLYDEVSAPGCNQLAAYSNLVSRLNACGVTPPPRAVVKRWVAAVQGGMAERPVLPGGVDADIPQVPQAGYFESLPEAAMPALADVWDSIQMAAGTAREEVEDERAFDAFFDAMRAIGHPEPEWRAFVAFARAIRLGQVERPARQIAEEIEDEPAEAEAGPVPEEPFERLDPATFRTLTSSELDEEVGKLREVVAPGGALPKTATLQLMPGIDVSATADDALSALRAVRNQLIADAYARLQADLRRQAERIVIDQLRSMADELEAGAA